MNLGGASTRRLVSCNEPPHFLAEKKGGLK